MKMHDRIPLNARGGDARRELPVLLSVQAGILDRSQALSVGFPRDQISHRLRSGAWRRVYPGV